MSDKINIIYKHLNELKPYKNNPRNNEESVDALVNSIKEFGFKVPIVIDKNNEIITGHTRLKAATKLGMLEVPCIIANDLSEDQIKAFRLADNKVGESSTWDLSKLTKELDDLKDKFNMEDFNFLEEDLEALKVDNSPISKIKKKEIEKGVTHTSNITLYNGDCLKEMKKIKDNSVDLILTDLPYGTTDCKWDEIIPFDDLWKEYDRVLKENGVIALFADNGVFEAKVINSKMEWFKYNWIWKKSHGLGFLNAKKQPLRNTESISIFIKPRNKEKNEPIYNPQMVEGEPYKRKGRSAAAIEVYSKFAQSATENEGVRYPTQILEFNYDDNDGLHPTQKPVDLLKYIIKTYTNEGMLVLDSTMGSGSTGVAAKALGRDFIGIELNKDYYDIAQERIKKVI